VVKSSTSLRMHAQCTGRYIESLQNGHPTAIHSTLSPLRLCGSITAGVPC